MSTKKIDALYLQGKEQVDSFVFYYVNLRPLLWKYARAIAHQNLNHVDDHVVDEMVDDLLMDISAFRGDSKFSTWAYVRFRRRCIGEYRYVRKSLGDSLDSLKDDWAENRDSRAYSPNTGGNNDDGVDPYDQAVEASQETDIILKEFKERLSERQLAVLEARILGHTFEEIGVKLGFSTQRAYEIWARSLELAKEYGRT